jgi:hypothetical protein
VLCKGITQGHDVPGFLALGFWEQISLQHLHTRHGASRPIIIIIIIQEKHFHRVMLSKGQSVA